MKLGVTLPAAIAKLRGYAEQEDRVPRGLRRDELA
jgi:hypothetical protein